MSCGNLAVVGGESRAESSSRIALDQDDVGVELIARVFHRIDDATGEHAQRLVRTHNVQGEVWLDLEVFERLIEHRTMLTGRHHGGFEFSRPAAQILDHQGELDGVGPRAQDCDNPAGFWQFLRSPRSRCTRRTAVDSFDHSLLQQPFAWAKLAPFFVVSTIGRRFV
jgi:hypothetical protein